jgi:hypothetical protein
VYRSVGHSSAFEGLGEIQLIGGYCGPGKVSAAQVGARQDRPLQVGAAQVSVYQHGTLEIGMCKVSRPEIGIAQDRTAKVGAY